MGDEVDVALDAVEDGTGETRLSRDRAKRQAAWDRLVKHHESGEIITGLISGKVKGGFTVELGNNVRAFLPGSLIDVRPLRDTSHLEGKEVELKLLSLMPNGITWLFQDVPYLKQQAQVLKEKLY